MERLFKHPKLIVGIIAALTIFFGIQLPRATLDNNNFRFVPENDPSRLESKSIDDTFGSQIYILVGLERRHGTVLDGDFIAKIRDYGDKIQALPVVDSVSSLVTSDFIGGSADGITVEPLVGDDFTGTAEEVAALRDKLLAWDLYRRSLVSDDFTATEIMVSLNLTAETAGTEEATGAYDTIRDLAYKEGFRDTEIYITGTPVFSAVVNEATSADLRMLIPLVVIVVLGVLFFSFRRIGGIVLPLLTVAIAATWAIGAMALLDVKLSIISTVLPVILVAVGSAYGIHVMSHYYDEIAAREGLDEGKHRRLVIALMRKVGRPVMLAALTTFAGFGSLSFTSVIPIREFGIFSSFGVLVAFVVSVLLIPSLYLIRGPDPKLRAALDKRSASTGTPAAGSAVEAGAAGLPAARSQREDRGSAAIADGLMSVVRKPWTVIFLALVAVAISVFGLSRLVIDNVLVEYFRSGNDVVKSDQFIREKFGGSKSVSVVVRSDEKGGVLDPAVLAAMDGLSTYLKESVPEVGSTMGFTDMVKRINQVFNADESPEGLRRGAGTASSPAAGVPSAGSGAAADSGTPAFGFGDAGSGGAASGSAEPSFGFGASGNEAAGGDAEPAFGFGSAATGSAGSSAQGTAAAVSDAEPAFGFGSAPASAPAARADNAATGAPAASGAPATAGAAATAGSVASGEAGSVAASLSGMRMVALLSEALADGGHRDMSADELVASLAKKFNYRGASYYEIPADPKRYGVADAAGLRALVSNYLVLLSGDIGSFADDPLEPKAIRMNVQLRTVGQRDTDRAMKAMEGYIAEYFPKNVSVEIGGVALVEGALNRLVVQSQLISVGLSLLVVLLILTFYYRSLIAGLIGVAPLSVSILVNFGVMGLTGIKLNIGTAMVASVAVGIGIDYTIHYLAAYHHEYLLRKDGSDFRRRTFLTSGKAILLNAASVGAGFAVLMLSQFTILSYLGFLIALTMVTSAVVSLTLLPVLLDLVKPAFIRRPLPYDTDELALEDTK